MYAQPAEISSAIQDLRAIRQQKGEVEQAYAKRLNDAVRRCGSVYDRDEVMTLFTEGLDPETRTLVQAYRADHHKATYLELIQQA